MKQRKPASTMTQPSGKNPFFNLSRRGKDKTNSPVSKSNRIKSQNIRDDNIIGNHDDGADGSLPLLTPTPEHDDTLNYALLIALYTLQGIPIGLSASIPFLIQQKVKMIAAALSSTSTSSAAAAATSTTEMAAAAAATAGSAALSNADISALTTKVAYNAQAIFALCSWPFSLKLLWAPIVDAIYLKGFGRRKSWLVPVQLMASFLMIFGSDYVESQLGLESLGDSASVTGATTAAAAANLELQHFDVKGVTAFFLVLYFLMATQDIAVDGWALTMLSRKNRGRGPVCNSIGQNLGYFLAFVGFLALNDVDSSNNLWRPLLGLKSDPSKGLVSLGSFIKFMGGIMLVITTLVALLKKEVNSHGYDAIDNSAMSNDDDDAELDAATIGIAETYKRLWSVCKLPSVRLLFLVLLTYRFPTALSDKVKFLKAVEFGMSKQTTALLAPTIILPLGIAVPIIATKIWKNHPLKQFMTAYKLRVTLVPFLDVCMLLAIRTLNQNTDLRSNIIFWALVVSSTALFSIVESMQFNSQMVFFAHRVDPAIGGSYMTLLNTAANLGGTWPASIVMFLVGQLTVPPTCETSSTGAQVCSGGREAYFPMQMVFSILGIMWVYFMGKKVMYLSALPDDAWRTNLDDEDDKGNKDSEKGK